MPLALATSSGRLRLFQGSWIGGLPLFRTETNIMCMYKQSEEQEKRLVPHTGVFQNVQKT